MDDKGLVTIGKLYIEEYNLIVDALNELKKIAIKKGNRESVTEIKQLIGTLHFKKEL